MSRVALCFELSAGQTEKLRKAIGADELVVVTGENHPEDCLLGCEIAFGNPPSAWLSAAAESVRWVQLESVGFGEYAALDWPNLGSTLKLTNLAGFFADPVAETALAGLLALGRGIDQVTRLKDGVQWEGDPLRTRLKLLKGSHVVMVGFGAINQRLAELLAPFHCRITTIRSEGPVQALDDALREADIVVCTAPDTAATRNLFDKARLALLPAHAIFANFGRGSIVDEAALVEALMTRRIAGAVLDVTRDEPLPPDHALWRCPNTLLTQHSGGGTADELDRKIDVFLANLDRYRRGEALQNIVDFVRGY
jgi:phosphoglycerate dehydrogenase-like enzyme